ncbi:LLM class flavin-dependent oxidoreductase [Streptomyces sp. MNU76]|uniref:MupA/Atu3671 family FMN-dependent luciferase-like monooxygenase n=1 Tax=Streptomyces sp. MNU76 TaxID=2560026 RepID=UPI001E420CA2|nr:MupA/Atu3671 family FMN-dependent luciferase-like monooxygenase [Streptomyces sp. MNU76]MCC9711760.1 LLM class flavin-dependent oxidoreductase [Streptomyces sp. MNU76]
MRGDEATADLLMLSARTPQALRTLAETVATHLGGDGAGLLLADVAYTLHRGRRQHPARAAVVAGELETAARALKGGQWTETGTAGEKAPAVALVLPGQGSQRPGMFQDLYRHSAVFRRHVTECSALMAEPLGLSLSEAVFGTGEDASRPDIDLHATQYAQPALFMVCTAAGRLLEECGIRPSAMLGHSLGELSAACLAGVFSLADAAHLAVARGKLMQQAEPGAMLAVPLSEESVATRLPDGLEIAAVNGPLLTVVSGPVTEVERYASSLGDEDVPTTRLRTSHAFHSGSMDPAVEPFTELVAACAPRPPEIPVISTVTGDWLRTEEATDPAYWGRQIRLPVRYLDAVSTLFHSRAADLVVDTGPGPSMAVAAPADTSADDGDRPSPLLVATHGNRLGYLKALGAAWTRGCEVDLQPMGDGRPGRRVSLPGYPFARRKLWVDGRFTSAEQSGGHPPAPEQTPAPGAPELSRKASSDWFWTPVWRAADPGESAVGTVGNWLVLTADGTVGDAFSAAVYAAGGTSRVVRVEPSELRLPGPEGPQKGDELIVGALAEPDSAGAPVTDIAYLLPSECAVGDSPEITERAAFHGLVVLAQALAQRDPEHAPRLHVVTAGAHAVRTGDTVVAEQAMVLGPVRVLPLENPGLSVRAVDLDPLLVASAPDRAAEDLLAELRSPGPAVVALRDHTRYEQDFTPVDPVDANDTGDAPEGPALRQGGTYVITGGLGGIGATLARLLTTEYDARVLLVGRSPLGERQHVLDELGGPRQVHYTAVDVRDEEQLGSALAEAAERFGRIDGVFHCAGVAGAGLTAQKTEDEAVHVLGPKVAGTRALRGALAGHEPDFVLLCSSHNSLLGRFGQVDYCAANAFLDAFAYRENGQTRWLSVNWDVWAEVGMALETDLPEQLRQWRQRTLAYAIQPEEAGEAVRRALAVGAPQVIVSTRDFRQVAARHTDDEANRFRHAVGRLAASKPARSTAGSSTADAPPRTPLESRLTTLWCDVLGVDSVGLHDDFLDLGGHSLVATILLARIRREHGCRISLRSFLERPTVAAVVAVIEGRAPEVSPSGDGAVSPPPSMGLTPPASGQPPSSTGRHAPVARVEEPGPITEAASPPAVAVPVTDDPGEEQPVQASLLFFSADASRPGGASYDLVLQAARFADEHGFQAVWLPERHFAAFGGLYPNPAVVAAALAVTTSRVRLRAGSVISPLHHPVRIAEEWAVVDRLSGGRVDLSFGSGWHVNDFVLAPRSYDARKSRMLEDIDMVTRLWRGERAALPNGAGETTAVRVYPAPARRQIDVWLTGESRSTFEQAGRMGANVLTAMMHQQPDALEENIAAYREAREAAGHDPQAGQVTLMQHTFCSRSPDAVWSRLEAAFERYISANLHLQSDNAQGLGAGGLDIGPAEARVLAERRLTDLVERRGIIGDVEHCATRFGLLRSKGVDEIACLVDFLPDDDLVLDGLHDLRTAVVSHRATVTAGERAL